MCYITTYSGRDTTVNVTMVINASSSGGGGGGGLLSVHVSVPSPSIPQPKSLGIVIHKKICSRLTTRDNCRIYV